VFVKAARKKRGADANSTPSPSSQICSIAPPTDFRARIHPKLAPEPGHRAALRPWATNFFAACYLVANSNRNDPLLSPICADPSSFPKSVYIATGTGDTLYEDGHGLIEMLKANNHPNAIFRAAKGEGHGFEKWKTDDPNNWATIVFDEIASVVRGSWQSQKESKL
jgi:acetyl esterase/lipase